jgi:hypothetical protein
MVWKPNTALKSVITLLREDQDYFYEKPMGGKTLTAPSSDR